MNDEKDGKSSPLDFLMELGERARGPRALRNPFSDQLRLLESLHPFLSALDNLPHLRHFDYIRSLENTRSADTLKLMHELNKPFDPPDWYKAVANHNPINPVLELQKRFEEQANQSVQQLPLSIPKQLQVKQFDLSKLHPDIDKVAGRLIQSGNYTEAVQEVGKHLIEQVRNKSRIVEMLPNNKKQHEGRSLMDFVFAQNDKAPTLTWQRFNEYEHQQVTALFVSSTLILRNLRAHNRVKNISRQEDGTEEEVHYETNQEALEWIFFGSALLRLLDEAELKID